jgi:hypothetical protein
MELRRWTDVLAGRRQTVHAAPVASGVEAASCVVAHLLNTHTRHAHETTRKIAAAKAQRQLRLERELQRQKQRDMALVPGCDSDSEISPTMDDDESSLGMSTVGGRSRLSAKGGSSSNLSPRGCVCVCLCVCVYVVCTRQCLCAFV